MSKKFSSFILLFFISLVCSCSIDNKNKPRDIRETMSKIKLEPCTADMKDVNKEDFCKFFGAKKEDIKDFCGIMSKKSSSFDEIFLMEVSDLKNLDKILKIIKENNEQKLNQAISYDSNQAEILKKRILFSKSNFIFSIISKNSNEIKDIIVKNF